MDAILALQTANHGRAEETGWATMEMFSSRDCPVPGRWLAQEAPPLAATLETNLENCIFR